MRARWRHRLRKNFEPGKDQCLSKRDKSFAGRIDVKAVDICSVINDREEFYTTSSCAGRCFLYQGHGIKSSHFLDSGNKFERFRISHDLVTDESRYFDLSTIETDPTGGGDPVRSIGQFEHGEKVRSLQAANESETGAELPSTTINDGDKSKDDNDNNGGAIWLRFEPFILHVCCRSLAAASALMAAARPSFKNVGLTTWKEQKYLVAVWGDEGLDMPITTPEGAFLFEHHRHWLKEMINERHQRNWSKIDRFVESVRALSETPLDDDDNDDINYIRVSEGNRIIGNGDSDLPQDGDENMRAGMKKKTKIPRSYDTVGDIALVYALPEGVTTAEEKEAVGRAILDKNKAIKVCVLRSSTLSGSERAPGEMEVIAGAHRDPLVTTHSEYGIRCVVDLNSTFFSPRMGHERLRICQQVARGERVLVLFAGVGMEALQIAARSEASKILAVELNPVAVKCARNSQRMLARNKAIKCIGAAERLEFIESDVKDVLSTLEPGSFDRVLAPRPKEGKTDGDLGDGNGGREFLEATIPVMKDRGEIHWYDFVPDHEFPQCERTVALLRSVCQQHGKDMEVIHTANAGSVAKRQLRVCIDFRVLPTVSKS